MKIILGIFLSCFLLQSCMKSSDFDLAKIILNQDKISKVIPKDIKLKTYNFRVADAD